MPTDTESAEDFTPLPSGGVELERRLTNAPYSFDGNQLAPYSLGAEGVADEALIGIKGDALYALTFLQVLTDLQQGFDRYAKDGWDGGQAKALVGDAIINAATAEVLKQVHGNVALYQARANALRGKVGRKGVATAIDLVNAIVKESKDSELLSGEAGDNEPGK